MAPPGDESAVLATFRWDMGLIMVVASLPVVSIVVPFGGYLIGSLLYICLNQKRNYTMETIGRGFLYLWQFRVPFENCTGTSLLMRFVLRRDYLNRCMHG